MKKINKKTLRKKGNYENPFLASIINSHSRPYLKWLYTKKKKAEGRINSKSWRQININDWLLLQSNATGEYLKGIVTFKHEYKSFEIMLKTEGVTNMLPFLGPFDISKAISVYENFPGSSRVKIYGCVTIGIQPKEWKIF